MQSPYDPPTTTSGLEAETNPPKGKYLIANFLMGLVGLIQFSLASLGALGVYSYATASPSNPEAYQANIAAVAVVPMWIGLVLISAFAYRAMRSLVYAPIRRWFIATSFLPLAMVAASFIVPLFVDGPPML